MRLIQLRPYQLKDLRYARFAKPFHDAGLIEVLDTDTNIQKFITDVVLDEHIQSKNLEHITEDIHSNIKPSDLYQKIKNKDTTLPGFLITNIKNGRYSNIEKIRSSEDMLQALIQAHKKGLINIPESLEGVVYDAK